MSQLRRPALARPKSSTLTTPAGVTLMFAGLRSRWTMPLSCAAARASAICRAVSRTSVDADAPALDAVGERRSLHQLQHERGRGALVLDAVDGADVRMVERGQHARFALESREASGSDVKARGRILIATSRPSLRVARAVDLAHAARTERRHHVVLAEATAGGQAGRRRATMSRRLEPSTQLGNQGFRGQRPLVGERRIGAVGREQRFDIATQRLIVGHGSRDERGALGGRLFDRSLEQPLDTQPAIIGHT